MRKQVVSRRELFQHAAGGFASIALAGMLAEQLPAQEPVDPLAPRRPHFVPRAKRVIFLYMTGGVSHVDTFDPRPQLFARHGQSITVDNWQGRRGTFYASAALQTNNSSLIWRFVEGLLPQLAA